MHYKVKDIINIMESIAPVNLAENWDNVGLILGDREAYVNKILVTLDITGSVINEAREKGIDMIISHHPIMFKPVRNIDTGTVQGKILWTLIQSGISVYSAHTNLDKAPGGMDDSLAKALGLKDIKPLMSDSSNSNYGSDANINNGFSGFGRIGHLTEEKVLRDYLDSLKSVFDFEQGFILGDENKKVGKIASCCGAGGDFLGRALELEADVFITGEIKYHEALEALETGMTVVAFGHAQSEYPGIRALNTCLQKTIDTVQYNIEVILSEYQFNPYCRRLGR